MSNPYAEVIGDPVAHSKSPLIHRFWLEKAGIEGDYRTTRVEGPGLSAYLAQRRADPDWRGCNVTVPHKHAILEFVPRVSPAAQAARSVNTVGFESDGAWGDTTDGLGMVEWLDYLGWSVAGGRVHLLGAGGAARSLALALRDAGAFVSASARRPDARQRAHTPIDNTGIAARHSGHSRPPPSSAVPQPAHCCGSRASSSPRAARSSAGTMDGMA